MKPIVPALLIGVTSLLVPAQQPELRIPAFTAYLGPDPEGARISRSQGITGWRAAGATISWFGELKSPGRLEAAIALTLPKGDSLPLQLSVGTERHQATAHGQDGEVRVPFGEFTVPTAGYVHFELMPRDSGRAGRAITALLVDGPAAAGARFNLDSRRNAASVHLRFPVESTAQIVGFYSEIVAVDDPVTTYYMATGFSRGYFGMQVNSPTERRIIFSVWDAASGTSANDRSTVADENQTQLVAKGEGVEASVFGNEGTGGHSHLVYHWKTASIQRFYVTAVPEGTNTVYTGYWLHPEKQQWQLIASFRAPKDGGGLKRLYSFSENFGGATGHLRRKALFGPEWIHLANGSWQELTTATFSHDATGKASRLDRFMGVENGRFFLSHGGFIPGFTASGDKFTRPASGTPPDIHLPTHP
jgi:hypothetical protein